MVKNWKSIPALLLCVAILTSCFTACGPSSGSSEVLSASSAGSGAQSSEEVPNLNTEGFPIVNEKIVLNITCQQTTVQSDFNDMVILKNYEEKSNIDVNWTCIASEFVSEKRNIIMASNELPDAFFKMGFSATDVYKYAKEGSFVNLSPLIEKYAPDVKAVFEEFPEAETGLTMPDGNVYSLSYILAAPAITSGGKPFFNSEALEMIGKEVPATLDEFTEVLRAFKTLDYNGNGIEDEIPYTSFSVAFAENWLKGSFGLGTRGGKHAYVDVDKDGNLRFQQTSDAYKQLLQYENQLYTEGLLDQEIFSTDLSKLIAKGEEGRALCYSAANHAIIGSEYGDKAVGLSQPLVGPNGDQLWNNQSTSLSGVGNFIITGSNSYPEATMRWENYWYSDDGIREYFMGVEGETYYVDENGDYQYTDYVMNNPDGINYEQVLGAYVPWAGGGNPSVANEKYFKGGEMQSITKASSDALYEYAPETIWPALMWNEEDVDDMATISTDIETYLNENRALFITGQKSFDEWDNYVKGFEALRIDRYLEIYQNALTRYGLS